MDGGYIMTLYRNVKKDVGLLVKCSVCKEMFQYEDLLVLSELNDLHHVYDTVLFGCPCCHNAIDNLIGVFR